MSVGDLITGDGRYGNGDAVFRVLRVSRNGWLTCQHWGDRAGRRTANSFICKWRVREMLPWKGVLS